VKGAAFEGGQTPLQRRLPKRGFSNAPFAKEWRILNVERLNNLPAGSHQDAASLVAAGVLPDGPQPLKVLGGGELRVALTVVAHAFSATAREKITAAGGRVEVVGGEAQEA
jgi:large subunit ribosomal protein L15